jgi:hypothetical protein
VSAEDVELAGVADDPIIRDIEMNFGHNVFSRQFLLGLIPEGSTGAELGVFTGMFSALLAQSSRIAHISFVDPWWLAYGTNYPDWGPYTDFGRMTTAAAYATAVDRITRSGLPGRVVEVNYSEVWLDSLPDASLDWAYVDSSHDYDHKLQELALLDRKLRPNGIIIGDDWWVDVIMTAVNDFLKTHDFDLVFAQQGNPCQWLLRRKYEPRRWVQHNDLRTDLGIAWTFREAGHTRHRYEEQEG